MKNRNIINNIYSLISTIDNAHINIFIEEIYENQIELHLKLKKLIQIYVYKIGMGRLEEQRFEITIDAGYLIRDEKYLETYQMLNLQQKYQILQKKLIIQVMI